MKRKIGIVTATRAEYGALRKIIAAVHEDSDLELQLMVTGTHLAQEYGYTLSEIEQDNFPIAKKIEILLSSDSPVSICKSMGLAQISFAEAFNELKPDLIVIIGDRYELVPIATCANILHIPLAHISGGEITEGALDDLFRHALTKLSNLHFVAHHSYANRLIHMGENPDRVFTVGEPGIEDIHNETLLTKDQLEASLKIKLKEKNFIITLHPETLGTDATPEKLCESLLNALPVTSNTLLIFTKSNADSGGMKINELLATFCKTNKNNAVLFDSLGKHRYLSMLAQVDGIIGNSSSGITEAPSFKIGTINIGNRQKGRIRANSVIDVSASIDEIKSAIKQLYSEAFKKLLQETVNPYHKNNTSLIIKETLKCAPLEALKSKVFYDPPNS